MYTTKKNIVSTPPSTKKKGVCGRYIRYPNLTGRRCFEGGMRLRGQFKRSSPEKPLVTVVTSVFNREMVLERALCSVLGQTYDNIEYIVIDAMSSDSTLEKILKYDDVLDYYVSEPDSGMYEGFNKGLSLASGEYILILNSDDWYQDNTVERLVSTVSEPGVEYVAALAREVDGEGKVLRDIPAIPLGQNVFMRMPLRHELMLVPAYLYDAVGGYDPTYRIIGDLKCTQRLFMHCKGFKQLHEYLMYFRQGGEAGVLTSSFIAERKRLLAENFPYLDEDELQTLASELRGNILKYKEIFLKYRTRTRLAEALQSFLRMQKVDAESWVK